MESIKMSYMQLLAYKSCKSECWSWQSWQSILAAVHNVCLQDGSMVAPEAGQFTFYIGVWLCAQRFFESQVSIMQYHACMKGIAIAVWRAVKGLHINSTWWQELLGLVGFFSELFYACPFHHSCTCRRLKRSTLCQRTGCARIRWNHKLISFHLNRNVRRRGLQALRHACRASKTLSCLSCCRKHWTCDIHIIFVHHTWWCPIATSAKFLFLWCKLMLNIQHKALTHDRSQLCAGCSCRDGRETPTSSASQKPTWTQCRTQTREER